MCIRLSIIMPLVSLRLLGFSRRCRMPLICALSIPSFWLLAVQSLRRLRVSAAEGSVNHSFCTAASTGFIGQSSSSRPGVLRPASRSLKPQAGHSPTQYCHSLEQLDEAGSNLVSGISERRARSASYRWSQSLLITVMRETKLGNPEWRFGKRVRISDTSCLRSEVYCMEY